MKPAGVCAVVVAEGAMDHFTSELFIAVMCPAMISALFALFWESGKLSKRLIFK